MSDEKKYVCRPVLVNIFYDMQWLSLLIKKQPEDAVEEIALV